MEGWKIGNRLRLPLGWTFVTPVTRKEYLPSV
jgi:hypothetical protein